MKYIILADSNNVEPFTIPRQLSKINGETIVGRTIRLLKENGIKDIIITSHDPRFDNLGATRYEPKYNDYSATQKTGYWLNAFPRELLVEPVTFLLGDVYYSENAIKTIVNTETDSTLFFCSDRTKGLGEKYIKQHDEPFAYKVVDTELFKEHIEKVKRMYDEGLTRRHPIVWELYRSINGIDVNTHKLVNNYVAINDETCDIDRVEDVLLIEYQIIGGDKMVKVEVIQEFTLEKFNEIKNIVRKGQDEKGKLFVGDKFECTKDIAEYLTGKNAKNVTVVKVIEVIPDIEDAKVEENASNTKQDAPVQPKRTRKKTTKKEE